MNYFIIPGNPPAVHFYELWGNEIIAKAPAAKVKVSHYPRLAKNPNSESAMKEVVSAHREQLMAFYNETNSPITIVGHSLGGNIGLRILHENMNEVIKEVILLHPFLRSPEKIGKVILKAAAFFYGKDFLQSSIIKNRKFLELLSKELPHVSNEEIEKSFHLARHESILISPDRTPVHIHHEKRDKVSVFYSPKDTWCTPAVLKDLRQQVKLFECTEPHDFVTSKLHRQSLLDKILT